MKQITVLCLLSMPILHCMDNPPKPDWTSKKGLAAKYGASAAQFLEIVTATPPSKIEDLKAKDEVIIQAASALYEKRLDEIFTPNQWKELERANVLPIIDKYRPDGISTWQQDESVAKTVPNAKRKKREYCYTTPKHKRFLSTIQPSTDRPGITYILQQTNYMYHGIKEAIPLQSFPIPLNVTEIDIDTKKNGKLITLSYKDASGNNKTQLWKAQRNIKKGLGFYLKGELSNQARFVNSLVLKDMPETDTAHNSGVELLGVLKKYQIPLDDFMEMGSNPNNATALPAFFSKHVPANDMPNFVQEFGKCYENMLNINTSSTDIEENTNTEKKQTQFIENQRNFFDKTYTYSFKQALNEVASAKKD